MADGATASTTYHPFTAAKGSRKMGSGCNTGQKSPLPYAPFMPIAQGQSCCRASIWKKGLIDRAGRFPGQKGESAAPVHRKFPGNMNAYARKHWRCGSLDWKGGI